MEATKITKKELSERSTYQNYSGYRNKVHVFFYDWKVCKDTDSVYWGGYKYRIAGDAEYITKKELFELLYIWITKGFESVPEIINGKFTYTVNYKEVKTDIERFKIPLSIKL